MEEKLKEIEKLINLNDYDNALKLCDEVISQDEKCVMAYILKSEVYIYLEKYNAAIDNYTEAIRIIPDDEDLYTTIAGTQYFCFNNYKDAKKNYEKAIEIIESKIELDPNNSKLYFKRGEINCIIKNYESALQDFTKIIEIDSNNQDAYQGRIMVKYELKDFEGVIEDYTKMIEIDSNNSQLYFKRGEAKNRIKNQEGAIEDYKKAIEIDPTNSRAYFKCALILKKLGDLDEAIKYYKAIETNADDIEKDYELDCLKEKIEIITNKSKNNPSKYHFLLGEAMNENGYYNSAIKHYELAFQIKKSFIIKMNIFSCVLKTQGFSSAIKKLFMKY